MSYIENCNKYRDTIIQNFEEAKLVKNCLDKDLIKELLMYQFTEAYNIKWQDTSRNLQAICDIDEIFEKIPVMQDIFERLLGKFSEHHTGNFYITSMLHDAHCDLLTQSECESKHFTWAEKMIPYKSAIIPLVINEDAEAYTAFFRQRHIGYSITLDKMGRSEQGNSLYEISREYPKFYDYGPTLESDYRNPLLPKGTVDDLQYENIFKFEVGDIMLFDACQIHMSVVDSWKEERDIDFLKSGINIQFYREVKGEEDAQS